MTRAPDHPETDVTAAVTRPSFRALLDPRLITVAVIVGGFLLLAFSAFIQDLGWLLWGAERSLRGGEMYVDFVEINPPMILLLNLIPQSITQLTGINAVITFDVFIALLLTGSLLLTRSIYRRTEAAGHAPPWVWTLPVLLFAFLIVATSLKAWGQREFITAVLVLPYVALTLSRFHQTLPSNAIIFLSAVMCGIGIGIKPHFLLGLAGLEMVLLLEFGFVRKVLWRLELVVVALLLTSYLILSALVVPEYFTVIGALGGKEAYSSYLSGRFNGVFHFATLYSVMAILVSAAVPSRPEWRGLRRVLAGAAAGFVLSGIAQQKGFDYHLFPALVFSTALFALTLSERGSRRRLVLLAVSMCMLVISAKIGSRVVRTARMVVTVPGTALSRSIDILDTYAPNGAVVGISLHMAPLIPAITYADVDWGTAFGPLWPLLPSYADQRNSNAPIRYHARADMKPLERYMFDRIIDDLVKRPPNLIVFRRLLTDELYGDGRFNYISYFSQDERFRTLFANYRQLPVDDFLSWYARSDVAEKPFTAGSRRFGTRWSHNCDNCLD